MKYFPCELHCHTRHSDGDFTPETLVKTARERLLEGIALTDHNTLSAVTEAAAFSPPLVLPGVELTTFFGHMPVLCPKGWVEWRDLRPEDGNLLLQRVLEKGGIAGIAHPYQLGTPICTGGHWDYQLTDFQNLTYMEIWSEGQPQKNSANLRALHLWYSLLDKGFSITPTMGRDWHRAENNLYPAACTYLGVDAEKLTIEGMLSALRGGRTVLSVGPLLQFQTEDGKTLGETISLGRKKCIYTLDNTRWKKVKNQPPITPEILQIISNGGTILAEKEIPAGATQIEIEVDFKEACWFHTICLGEIGEKENQWIALTAASYAKKGY